MRISLAAPKTPTAAYEVKNVREETKVMGSRIIGTDLEVALAMRTDDHVMRRTEPFGDAVDQETDNVVRETGMLTGRGSTETGGIETDQEALIGKRGVCIQCSHTCSLLIASTDEDRYRRRRSHTRSPARHRPRSPGTKHEVLPHGRASPKALPNGVHKVDTNAIPPSGPRSLRQAAENKSESESKANGKAVNAHTAVTETPAKMQEMDLDSDPEIAEMQKIMGFTKFRTTKQTKVPGNDWYGKAKEQSSQYRQYMNRVGGFNRPLSPSR